MKTNVTKSDFREAFLAYGRQDQFSYEALGLLFEYFEELENDIGSEIDLDVIAICCEYAESPAAEIADNYRLDTSELDPEDDEALADLVRDYLNENTSIVGETSSGSFIYLIF